MRKLLRDRGVLATLAAVVPLTLATVFAPSLVLVVVGLWAVWAVVAVLVVRSALMADPR